MSVAVVLACDVLAAASCVADDRVVVSTVHVARPAEIRAVIREPYGHPRYGLEIEPHFVVQWTNVPFRTSAGVGLGFRASIPLIDPGPISGLNNNLALSFGLDWAHFGACRSDTPDCGGNDFWFPVAMQWNFYLTHWWSVFPELGVAVRHAWWGWYYYDDVRVDPGPPPPPGPGRGPGPGRAFDCGPRGLDVCEVTDSRTGVSPVAWLGTRFSLSDTFSFTLRVGFPSLLAGVSFRL